MIRAVLFEGRQGRLRGFLIEGHSHFADQGKDIVCAGVSTLVQACEAALEKYLSLAPLVKIVREPELQIKVMLPDHLDDQESRSAEVILGTLELGLQMIAGEYGKFIKLRRSRDDSEEI